MQQNKYRELTPDELNELYGNFINYRDNNCGGWAKIGIEDFYKKYGLNKHIMSAA